MRPSRRSVTAQKGYRIDPKIAEEFSSFCRDRGWKISHYLEIAMREWLEKQRARERKK